MITGNTKEPPTNEIAFMSKEEEENFSNFMKDTWYADGTVLTHMGNTDVGMFDYEDINEGVTVGNGKQFGQRSEERFV
jgi:hypothetical protein